MLHAISPPPHPLSQPRRAVSMPAISVPLSLSGTFSTIPLPMPNTSSPGRSAVRRVSYTLKSRFPRSVFPLALLTLVLFGYVFTSIGRSHDAGHSGGGHASHLSSSLGENARRLRWYRRAMLSMNGGNGRQVEFGAASATPRSQWGTDTYGNDRGYEHEYTHGIPPSSSAKNGVSLLIANEDELIAEDDLFWDSYKEAEPLTSEEIEAEKELQARRKDVLERNQKHGLQALIYWLAEGGVIPDDWEVPSPAFMRKVGGRGVERLLEDIGGGAIFETGWADFASKRYREVVFSKTYCPYSKNAKAILGKYHLSPAPFIIELDQRTDFKKIQTILEYFTGRRTVPNILLDFVSIGGSDEITLLHAEGGLKRRFDEMGVGVGSSRRLAKGLARL